jgi:hypothetical protein
MADLAQVLRVRQEFQQASVGRALAGLERGGEQGLAEARAALEELRQQ